MSVCGAIATMRTLAVQAVDALRLLGTPFWIEAADQLWDEATRPKSKPSSADSTVVASAGERPEAAASTVSGPPNLPGVAGLAAIIQALTQRTT